ncbi:MAG: HU family DNA-binding protein [Veillonella sp.]
MLEELAAGGKVQVIGFGTFEVRERLQLVKAVTLQNGKTITIAVFKPNPAFQSCVKGLKEQVNAAKAKKTLKNNL